MKERHLLPSSKLLQDALALELLVWLHSLQLHEAIRMNPKRKRK